MGPLMGVAAGAFAGLIGSLIWAALAYYTGFEIGYLAWGIGLLVGIAVAKGAGAQSQALGAVAVLITVLSICGGKLLVIDVLLDEQMADVGADPNSQSPDQFDESDMIARIAGAKASQREEAGETIDWPEIDFESMSEEEFDNFPVEKQFPPALWAEAKTEWLALPDTEKQQRREAAAEEMKQLAANFGQAMKGAFRWEAFKQSFGLMDLLFFGLGVYTAWGIASSGEEETAETA